MGFFARLTNLARGTVAARRSSAGDTLTESELEDELQTVRPPTAQPHSGQNSPTEHGTPKTQVDPVPEPAERDAEGNITKTL